MDRKRADTAAILGIHLSGLATNQNFSSFTRAEILDGLDPELNEQREDVRSALRERNIHFLYLGTKQEAQAIRKVVKKPTSFVPPTIVDVIDNEIYNTANQVHALKTYLEDNVQNDNNPYGFIPQSSTIFLPLGLQAIRVLPMLQQYQAVPEGMHIAVFPIPTPANGIHEYATLETKGRVYYTLTGEAAPTLPPYILLGNE